MTITIRKCLWCFLFGGRPDRLSWWQHATCWAAAVIVVAVPAVFLPVIEQHVQGLRSVTVAACPRVAPDAALATPPPGGYEVPSGCCGAPMLNAPDIGGGVDNARQLIRSGRSDITVCDWFRSWGRQPW